MYKYGIFYGYWIRNWEVDLEELKNYVAKVDELGFDIIELSCDIVDQFSSSERQELKSEGERRGINFTFNTNLNQNNDISSEEEEARRRGIRHLENSIKLIDEMDGEVLTGLTYGAWNPSFQGDFEEKMSYFDRSVESWRQVIKTAEDYDVKCTVEVVNRFEQFILNTAAEGIEFVERVDSPNLGILLDTYHMNIEEDSIPEAIEKAGDKLFHLHVGENNRKPPGRGGHIQWDSIRKALDKIDFGRGIVMEPFLLSGGEVGSSIGVWRGLSEGKDLDEEVRKSLEFLKRKLE
ncbi:hypothetical protein AKJ63_01775 [candidate division MSBL1 archaeon SCGC-AAA259D18]|uniref:Xylose isomerase-like TIM barrel domain-containing protein n=1 Tax=candidate division MSBL1 archaeon SCGC-AAA259D18 TaxID=1698262 RepID=A0A133UAJ7_9EURY|nr:hypothetical protein AKJ63_01775 [candidate division MSBL1 archaeon SCGC-AAA259D18]